MRLLILIALIYLGYRAVKSWLTTQSTGKRSVAKGSTGEIDDVMVKDPFCEVYFPKRDGVQLQVGREEYYFCSIACRDKFVAKKQQENKDNTY